MPLHPEYRALLAMLEEMGVPRLPGLVLDDWRALHRQLQPPRPDLPVGSTQDVTMPGPAGPIALRVYVPAGHEPFPVVLMFHGGGWVTGDLDTADSQCREVCAGAGVVVVSVDYRLAPEHPYPAAVDDCWAATVWASEHARDWGGDPGRLAVAGDSAGATLATVMTLLARDRGGPEISFQLLAYPVTDGSTFDTDSYRQNGEGYFLTGEAMEWFWDRYIPDPGQRKEPYASPLLAPSLAGLPPALVLTAELDPLRDEGEAYAARLQAEGVPCERIRFDGLIHGFFPHGPIVPAARGGMERACAALREAFARRDGPSVAAP